MPAVDPTYPLFPVVCILSSALLLLTLAVVFARQRWNLGVTFLCSLLVWENLTGGINAVLWSDNYDIKHYVYCDIVTHTQLITFVVKPMCTLIIVRRLYLIASLRSVELPSTREKRNNAILEWTLGLAIPLIVAGPLYYVVQGFRFEVVEGFGCANAFDASILTVLLIQSWSVVPPLISVAIYYPKVIWVFCQQRRDTNRFLQSNPSISRTNYFRILALASIDLLFTLPAGIANLVIFNLQDSEYYAGRIPFYSGWSYNHDGWAPVGYSYAFLESEKTALPLTYLTRWTSPALALIVFGLFGLTAEARATYWRAICSIGKQFRRNSTPRRPTEKPGLGTMEFGARPQDISLDAEMGSRPSFVIFAPATITDVKGNVKGEHSSGAVVESASFGSVADIVHHDNRAALDTLPHEQGQV